MRVVCELCAELSAELCAELSAELSASCVRVGGLDVLVTSRV